MPVIAIGSPKCSGKVKPIGPAQSTISDIETGVVSVSLDVYLRLLEPLGGELCLTNRATHMDTPGHGT